MKILTMLTALLLFLSCENNSDEKGEAAVPEKFYKGATLYFSKMLQEHGGIKYCENGKEKDPYQSLKDHGGNMVRVVLAVDMPWNVTGEQVDYQLDWMAWDFVQWQLQHCKDLGMEVFLTFQLARDNGENMPTVWKEQDLAVDALAEKVYEFVCEKLDWMGQNQLLPAIVAIGNETNITFCWDNKYSNPALAAQRPDVDAYDKKAHGAKMFNKGFEAVDFINEKYGTKMQKMIHLHIPGYLEKALSDWTAVGVTNYDIVGLSWYPHPDPQMGEWKSFGHIANFVRLRYKKPLLVTEVAVPYTGENYDDRENMTPSAWQQGLPNTPKGQREWMERFCEDVASGGGIGVIYWGGEWVANNIYVYRDFNGSTWEDKAFWKSERGNPVHELHEGIDWMKKDYHKK